MDWAKIMGVFMLSRRNIARIVAAISAAILAFHTAPALSPGDETLSRKASSVMCRILPLEDSLPPGDVRIAVSDHLFNEVAEVFLKFRHLLPGNTSTPPPRPAAIPRRYATRRMLSVPCAAGITGLSESTIKRLDKDPKNTNYPGRNSTPQMLAAWARLYRNGKIAAREVRAANRPLLGCVRC